MLSHIVADVYKKSEFSGCSVLSGSKTCWREFNRSPLSGQTSPDPSVDDGVGGEVTVMNVGVLGVMCPD